MSAREALQAAAQQIASLLPDALLIAGATALAWGAHMVYAPAGYITAGALLIAAGWLLSTKGGR